jgi:hypothetical protein
MNLGGVLIGGATFLVIGVFHPLVIKAEYHFGTRVWPVFLLVGVAGVAFSLFIDDLWASAILGVVGFSSLWSIREIFEQAKRVERGWFPKNPKRAD